jgi:hypothetical protein
MTPTGQVYSRAIAYGFVLSAIDAVSGRMLQASPDPSIVLSLGATAWVAYRLAESGQGRLAFPAAIALWLSYAAGFLALARLLVGWNGSVPWQPRSTAWGVGFVISVPIVAIAAQLAGARAAGRSRAKATVGATPHE